MNAMFYNKNEYKRLNSMDIKIDLSNKVALVSGASGELGRVISFTLAKCGADIIIHYHNNKDNATCLMEEINKIGKKALLVQADITNLNSVMSMKKYIDENFKAPDIIVNNAVIQYEWKSILNQSPEDYINQFNSSVMQSVYFSKAFIPAMIQKNFGRIIAINTECSMQNAPSQSAYVAGKRGMDGVLKVLAKEVGEHQITVNQVAPGWTITNKTRVSGTEKQKSYEENIPLKRRGNDYEVANVVAFLASDLANYITGAFIPVCGGNIMPDI